MRTSSLLISTLRETPADAEIISHQLMLRAGLIRKLASGLYTWLPLGLRVLRKVEAIIRAEMDASGAQEVLMPGVQPAELWQETGRWDQFGSELLRLHDRHQRAFCLGPTHEEVITDLVRREVNSYKQLPLNLYQIQTKFRDEVRPRFGVMRSREFIMKDAYSFHLDKASLEQTYEVMYRTYSQIFTRLGLDFRAVDADTGSIGGSASHEFHVLAASGEDAIAFSDQSDYAANIELAATLPATDPRPTATQALTRVATPGQHSIEHVCQHLGCAPQQTVKTLIVQGATEEQPLVALVVRGDHQLNATKAEKHPLVAAPLALAEDSAIQAALGCAPGSLGPVDLTLPLLVDHAAAHLADFVCGANDDGYHLTGVNWERDLPLSDSLDLREIEAGDPSPCGQGQIEIKRGIEVGHIFQLGDKYSQSLNAHVLNEQGKAQVLTMGCYGIGVTRVIAAAIEQNHDQDGIIWPSSIAPFSVAIVPMNLHKSPRVQATCQELYQRLQTAGIDVLFDDRKERPGVLFADMELIGIPHLLIIGDRSLDKGVIEYKSRKDGQKQTLALDELDHWLATLTA